MGALDAYLPPKGLWPERVYPLPDLRYPAKLNTTEELLDKQVEAGFGDRVALLFEDQRITYRQLLEQTNRLGGGLRAMGVKPFERVIIRAPNVPAAVVANFAIIKVGAVSVPTSPLLSTREIIHVVHQSEAAAMIVFAGMLPDVEKVRDQLTGVRQIIVIGGDAAELKSRGYVPYAEIVAAGGPDLAPVRVDRLDVSVLLFTSGTTGLPKGTAHLMEESLAIADTFGKHGWRLTPDDVLGGPAPMAFAAGYGAVAVIPYRFGAAASLIARFTPEGMFETIQRHRVTVLTVLPTSYRRMLQLPDAERYDLSSVRLCTGGGESLTAKTFQQWVERFGLDIYEGFGTTEMFYVFVSNAVTMKAKPGSVGTPVPAYEVKVVDDRGREVPRRTIGRLMARGPTGTLYWRDPERQRQAVRDGWNEVGDYVTADEDGYLWFVSREDDLIKSSGYRIGPEEVEEALKEHPAVGDAGVIGVPDPVRGQNVKAFVVVRKGHTAGEALTEELLTFLRERIAVYKLPREIAYVAELPRTVTGKLLRRVLREQQLVRE